MIMAIEPKIGVSMPDSALNQNIEGMEDLDIPWNHVPKSVKFFVGMKDKPTLEAARAISLELQRDPLKNELHSLTAKKILQSFKINVDEIEPKELFMLLSSRLEGKRMYQKSHRAH